MEDLFKHAFFATIDWDKLRQKMIDPPFKPTVVSDEAFYFDSTFTSKTPKGKQSDCFFVGSSDLYKSEY